MIEKEKKNKNVNLLIPEDHWNDFKIPKRGRFYSEHHLEGEDEINQNDYFKRTKDHGLIPNLEDSSGNLAQPVLNNKKTTSLMIGNLNPIENPMILIKQEDLSNIETPKFDYELKDQSPEIKRKKPRRLSRAISVPELNFNRTDSGSIVSQNNIKNSKKNIKTNHAYNKRENTMYSELFFHYYECFLKQLLMKLAIKKDKTTNTRDRFYSEYYK